MAAFHAAMGVGPGNGGIELDVRLSGKDVMYRWFFSYFANLGTHDWSGRRKYRRYQLAELKKFRLLQLRRRIV